MRKRLLFAIFATFVACSNASSGTTTCDAGACAAIEKTILDNGGGPGTCVEPTQYYEGACEAYAACSKQCGQ